MEKKENKSFETELICRETKASFCKSMRALAKKPEPWQFKKKKNQETVDGRANNSTTRMVRMWNIF